MVACVKTADAIKMTTSLVFEFRHTLHTGEQVWNGLRSSCKVLLAPLRAMPHRQIPNTLRNALAQAFVLNHRNWIQTTHRDSDLSSKQKYLLDFGKRLSTCHTFDLFIQMKHLLGCLNTPLEQGLLIARLPLS